MTFNNNLRETNEEGIVIVIDGGDGSGKTEQATRAFSVLSEELDRDVVYVDIPNYLSDSSTLVKKYLAGDYNNAKEFIDPETFVRQISSFYAVDRVSSFIQKGIGGKSLMERYKAGAILICNRYSTSNMIHQSAFLERDKIVPFIEWVKEFEYNQLGLPEPTKVIFLDVDPQTQVENLKRRARVIDENLSTENDIHENIEHLKEVSLIKHVVINHFGWTKIACGDYGAMRSIEDVHDDVMKEIKSVL